MSSPDHLETAVEKNVAESRRAARLVNAQPNLCWQNAVDLVWSDEFAGATYVEGAIISRKAGFPQEHGWVVFNGEIIDPTLPDWELFYFPAHQWAGEEFMRVFFQYEEKPFFKHAEFKQDAVQVEMDKARNAAQELADTWAEEAKAGG